MKIILTDLILRREVGAGRKPGAVRKELSDGMAVGLFARIEPGGSLFWCMRYTVKGGARRFEMEPGATMTLADARAWATQRRALARSGVDPVAQDEKAKRREDEAKLQAEVEAHEAEQRGRTVADFFEGFDYVDKDGNDGRERGYLARHVSGLKKARQTEQLWRKHILPLLGSKEARDLSRGDVAEALETLRERGLRGQVNRAQAAVTHFLGWMVDMGSLETNVAAGMRRRVKEMKRRRVLDDDELKAIWLASDNLSTIAQSFLRVLILTGQRRDDVRLMQWGEIGKEGRWVIPAERYKVRRDHEVILPSQARDIVFTRRDDDPVFVFASRHREKPYNGTRSLKSQLNRFLPGLPHWQLHDIRRTVRTGLASLGVGEEIAERILGHSRGDMVEVYNQHAYREEKAGALQAWSDRVERLIFFPRKVVAMADHRKAGGDA